MGTISTYSRDDRQRKDTIEKLGEKTTHLFEGWRREIMGWRGSEGRGDEVEGEEAARIERIERAWAAWKVALEWSKRNEFGVRSFGWIALGVLVEELGEWLLGDQE